MQLVYYSLAIPQHAAPGESSHQRQWIRSARSLRAYNQDLAVHLFVYGGPVADSLLREAAYLDIAVHHQGDYRTCLAALSPNHADALSHYPVLHKFLSLRPLLADAAERILYLDCDTFFFADVARLFDRYRVHDFYAREEPWSRRSHYGYRADYLEEDSLRNTALAHRLVFVPPYNTGVCLFNNHLGNRLASLCPQFLRYVWRLLTGIALGTGPQQITNPDLFQAVRGELTRADMRARLPYPSSNTWIVEQIAFLLTLGEIPGLSHHALSKQDVIQGGEFEADLVHSFSPLLAHYYSHLEEDFFARVIRLGYGEYGSPDK